MVQNIKKRLDFQPLFVITTLIINDIIFNNETFYHKFILSAFSFFPFFPGAFGICPCMADLLRDFPDVFICPFTLEHAVHASLIEMFEGECFPRFKIRRLIRGSGHRLL